MGVDRKWVKGDVVLWGGRYQNYTNGTTSEIAETIDKQITNLSLEIAMSKIGVSEINDYKVYIEELLDNYKYASINEFLKEEEFKVIDD